MLLLGNIAAVEIITFTAPDTSHLKQWEAASVDGITGNDYSFRLWEQKATPISPLTIFFSSFKEEKKKKETWRDIKSPLERKETGIKQIEN